MKHPKFILYIVGIIILLAIVGYALIANQSIRKIVFPGGEVQFEQPQPKDETTRFAVIHDTTHEVLPACYQTVVYIDGKISAKLVVEPKKRIAAASIEVPKPGVYSYVLEQDFQIPFTDPDTGKLYPLSINKQIYNKQMGGRGKINVKQGEAFIITRRLDFNDKPMLRLLSLEEDEAMRKEYIEMMLKSKIFEDLRLLKKHKTVQE